MNRSVLRNALCGVMIFWWPASMMAAERGAMVYVSGSTSVNGAAVARSSVVFPGDVVQTRSSSQANISAAGASVTIFENTSVRFEANGVSIEDGSISVGTKKQDMTTKAGVVTVTTASSAWTEFEMSHRNGAVQIIARKGDVNISAGYGAVTLLQGQSVTRDDSTARDGGGGGKKAKKDNDQPAAAASTAVLDSPIWIGVAAGAILAGLIYSVTRSGAPVSPSGL